ncbi:YbhB/YbcL family Raf kinase inhibitor-like protein [Marinomonas posidonica]|uniref:YbhB YbcL family protein n=1 Tax=Marinomonas posidonica (strain CECT 7376 / NCIMB 14433 / IVIA-Po-181) TaxID=491952 RepID=F6D0T4_MARPP|nr:YbhB/YbcL family Raf kinase inhibitor-like protein [Marinomonas posidonica]AEF55966.1 YbhB YbcL family protein [Marinomonas posidonica IVIA-Po-181]
MKKSVIMTGLMGSLLSMAGQAFELTSQDIQEGHKLPKSFEFNGFGCSGENKSPQLEWSSVPTGTKSFAITVYDPDAPSGSGWWHWSAFNIPASVTSLPQGADLTKLGATELKSDYGSTGFGGVCPPKGDNMHRYQFTVWALPVEKLDLNARVSAALAGFTVRSLAIDKAVLVAPYNR